MRRWPALLVLGVGVVAACSPSVSSSGDPDARGGPSTLPGDAAVAGADAAPAALRIDYLDPPHGPFAGLSQVIVHGNGFLNGMKISVGGRDVADVDLNVLDAHRVEILTPPGVPGPSDVVATAGGVTVTRSGGYNYDAIYVDPPTGAVGGGTYVTIRGIGTNFQDGDSVMLDGMALVAPTVVNGQELTGYTPPGLPGSADVVIAGLGGSWTALGGYTYEDTVDAFNGGVGGGPIDGAINIVLLDSYTMNGISGATVTIGDPATATLIGKTDPFGQLTLSAPGLTGPVTVVAGHPKYQSGAFVKFDAQNVTMFLTPLPDPTAPPPTGPFPPGRPNGVVDGNVTFGGITTIGTDGWAMIPAPTHEHEIKRTYVFVTAHDIFSSNVDPGDGGTVDYVAGQTAWHFNIQVPSSSFALVAISGLYDPDNDPDGDGVGTFVPYAMGVRRNLLAGPGEVLKDIAVVVDIPLDTAILVDLAHPPGISDPTTDGPNEYHVNALIDLGGEGVIRLPSSRQVFNMGQSALLTGLAPIANEISDASYAFVLGAYTANVSNPSSVRIVRGVRDLGVPVVVDDFIGVPRLLDPPSGTASSGPGGAMASRRHILMVPEAGTTGVPTFIEHQLYTIDGFPSWRIIARGDQTDIPLYDMSLVGLPVMSTDTMYMTSYFITIPGGNFDTFTYAKLNANAWSAYSLDSFSVAFPAH